jgi:hypothetical protein
MTDYDDTDPDIIASRAWIVPVAGHADPQLYLVYCNSGALPYVRADLSQTAEPISMEVQQAVAVATAFNRKIIQPTWET